MEREPKKPNFSQVKLVNGPPPEDKYSDIPLSHSQRYALYQEIHTGQKTKADISKLAIEFNISETRLFAALERAWQVEGAGR